MTSQERTQLDIERLLSSYALLIDSGDFDGALALFTDDCEFVFAGDTLEGRDAVRALFEGAAQRGRAGIHLPGPTLVDVEPDGVSASTWQSFVFVANGQNALTRGMYRDRLVYADAGWRFRRREVELRPEPG